MGNTKMVNKQSFGFEDPMWSIDYIYPVGSIYMSVNPTNPAEIFGEGTWVAWGAGRVPVGVDPNDSDFDTVQETGGSKSKTLATSNMPQHTHTYSLTTGTGKTTLTSSQMPSHTHLVHLQSETINYQTGSTSATGVAVVRMNTAMPANFVNTTGGGGSHDHTTTSTTANTGSAGSASAFSVVQPYITCYMWLRTA